MSTLTSIDGNCIPRDEATISITDDGLLRGDGSFEVVRIYGGTPDAWEDHLERLCRSCTSLKLDCPRELLDQELARLLDEAKPDDNLLRVVVTRAGRRILMLEDLPGYPPAADLLPVTYSPTVLLNGVKSLSYAANMLAGRHAREAGFDEALLVTPEGKVLEAPTSSVFWVSKDRLRTPALDTGILASITRNRLISTLHVEEGIYDLGDLLEASEVFIASTTREVQPVNRVGDRTFKAPGPVTEKAARKLKEVIERELSEGAILRQRADSS